MEWITDLWDRFILWTQAVFDSLTAMFQDLFWWVLDSLLGVAVSMLGVLDMDVLGDYNPAALMGALPPDLVNILGLIRIGEAFAIIVAAIVIRITMQLIPFVRLGS